MGNFITIPWIKSTTPTKTECLSYGIPCFENGRYICAWGSNASVPTPIIACAKYGTSSFMFLSLNSGFSCYSNTDGNVSRTDAVNTVFGQTGVYYITLSNMNLAPDGTYDAFPSSIDALNEFVSSLRPDGYRNISYSFENGLIKGPTFAPIGSTVRAYITGNPGASVSAENISVMKAGSPLQFSYSNGVLTFTAS